MQESLKADDDIEKLMYIPITENVPQFGLSHHNNIYKKMIKELKRIQYNPLLSLLSSFLNRLKDFFNTLR